MDRSEDLKQVRDLHLVRDEGDREVEAAAGLRTPGGKRGGAGEPAALRRLPAPG